MFLAKILLSDIAPYNSTDYRVVAIETEFPLDLATSGRGWDGDFRCAQIMKAISRRPTIKRNILYPLDTLIYALGVIFSLSIVRITPKMA